MCVRESVCVCECVCECVSVCMRVCGSMRVCVCVRVRSSVPVYGCFHFFVNPHWTVTFNYNLASERTSRSKGRKFVMTSVARKGANPLPRSNGCRNESRRVPPIIS